MIKAPKKLRWHFNYGVVGYHTWFAIDVVLFQLRASNKGLYVREFLTGDGFNELMSVRILDTPYAIENTVDAEIWNANPNGPITATAQWGDKAGAGVDPFFQTPDAYWVSANSQTHELDEPPPIIYLPPYKYMLIASNGLVFLSNYVQLWEPIGASMSEPPPAGGGSGDSIIWESGIQYESGVKWE